MLARNLSCASGVPRRTVVRLLRVPAGARQPVVIRGAAATESAAWAAWTPRLQARGAVPKVSTEEKKFAEIATTIGKLSKGFKPKFTAPPPSHGASFKLQHVANVQIKELPKDLHDKLETIGVSVLETALGLSELDYLNASFTTTDIDAALSVTGTVLAKDGEKNAVLAFVVTETERQASWSRLEGLILHWAVSPELGGAWAMPPEGWSATPSKSRDAGGAIQSSFEKQNVGGNEQMYVLVLQLPLRGILRTGGPVFVLKGTANQTDRWLQDSATNKDFFLDLQALPITKA